MNFERSSKENNSGNVSEWDLIAKVPFLGEVEERDHEFVPLEELEDILNKENCGIYGHGTGSLGNGHEVVESILRDGVKSFVSDGMAMSAEKDEALGTTDLTDNTVCMFTTMDGEKVEMSVLKNKLDNWKHRDSENVILMRLPTQYFNMTTAIESEKDEPFFVQKRDKYGQMRNYIDPRFVVGNYNRTTGMVEMNPQFEMELSEDFQAEIEMRLAAAKAKTEKRMAALDATPYSQDIVPPETSKDIDEDVSGDWDDDIDWN